MCLYSDLMNNYYDSEKTLSTLELDPNIVTPRAFKVITDWIECIVKLEKDACFNHLAGEDNLLEWIFEVFTAADYLNMDNSFINLLLDFCRTI